MVEPFWELIPLISGCQWNFSATTAATLDSKAAMGLAIPKDLTTTNTTIDIGEGYALVFSSRDRDLYGVYGLSRPPVGQINAAVVSLESKTTLGLTIHNQ